MVNRINEFFEKALAWEYLQIWVNGVSVKVFSTEIKSNCIFLLSFQNNAQKYHLASLRPLLYFQIDNKKYTANLHTHWCCLLLHNLQTGSTWEIKSQRGLLKGQEIWDPEKAEGDCWYAGTTWNIGIMAQASDWQDSCLARRLRWKLVGSCDSENVKVLPLLVKREGLTASWMCPRMHL